MKCPICDDVKMREIEKNGVLVDICPECKGVWLDRGELDKLMSGVREIRDEFNAWQGSQPSNRYDDREYSSRDDKSRDYDHRERKGGYKDSAPYYKKKKKENILDVFGDLFG